MVNLSSVNAAIDKIYNWWKNEANKLAVASFFVVIVLLLAMSINNSQRFSRGMAKVYETQSKLSR